MSTSLKENSIEEEPFVITQEELHSSVITQEPNCSHTRVSRQVPADDKDDSDGGYWDSTDESREDERDNEDPIWVNEGIKAGGDDVFGLGQLLEQLD
ncbi:hypothetical protein CDL15_Pgr018792 [Punica granatum]|uniref:Uncharacterized protein n=1 Tax=Punica granatum TaxID=22663 RepID=A0A218VW35_PUNGR|nr:hypothetical protein CDL15_Pgr018792 [Punica granatum]